MTNKELIRRGKKLLTEENNSSLFSTFSKIYPMTTENIKGTYELFDLNDKDILTVTSSGDHILCAALKGAKRIDSFDVNYLTEYYYYLKKAVIEAYDLDKFKERFLYSLIPDGEIKETWYSEFRDNLDGKYQEFWDEIISFSNSNGIPLNKLFLFIPNYNNLVNYLDEENYNLLKETLPNIETKFIHSDLMHLNKNLDKKYDYMFFSNISDYAGIMNVKDYAKTKLMGHLNENGEIAFAYMYEADLKKARLYGSDNVYPISSTVNDKNAKDYILTLK